MIPDTRFARAALILPLLGLLSACITPGQTKVMMVHAPEVAEAAKVKSVAVSRFGGQFGEIISNDLAAHLMNARVQGQPVYRSVMKVGDSRSLANDTRSLMATARSTNSDAIFVGEVVNASVRDANRQEQQYVCDQQEKSGKLFSKCQSGRNVTIQCIDRTATLQVQIKLVNAADGQQIYSEAIGREVKSTGCDKVSPTDGGQMLGALKNDILNQVALRVIPHERPVDIALMDSTSGLRPDQAARLSGGVNFAKEGRMDRACDIFREIYDSEKNSLALNYNLGVCEEAAGAYWKAGEYYQIADRLSPEPNKLLTAALARNAANIKKSGALAQSRPELTGPVRLESSRQGSRTGSRNDMELASRMVPAAPGQVTADMLMSEKRTALVIGNSKYDIKSLRNPVNDARAMADALRKLNFQVIALEDATHAKMDQALNAFSNAIQGGGVALVFYAGHGVQVKDANYLLPINNRDINSDADLPFKAMKLEQILARLEEAKSRVNIVILDACRDNPLASMRSGKGGLAVVDAPAGTVIAFATAPGKTAADGIGNNGLYTSHLLKQLSIPNQKIEDVLKNTRKAVATASNKEQIPWDSSSLTGDFYFRVSTAGH